MKTQAQFIFLVFFGVVFTTVVSGEGGDSSLDMEGLSLGTSLDSFPKDCMDIMSGCSGPESPSGVFLIKPQGYKDPFEVYCSNDVDGGGWTVIQRRQDGTIDFDRDWQSYKDGFGFLHTEFWIGNEKLAYLTNQDKYALRIDVINSKRKQMYLHYDNFRIGEEKGSYAVVELGQFEGNTTSNHMGSLQGAKFSTYDNDNAGQNVNCADKSNGGWWFKQCNFEIYLNGVYGRVTGSSGFRQEIGLRKGNVRDSRLRYTEMKIRPV